MYVCMYDIIYHTYNIDLLKICIYIYIYMCVCVCVCVLVRSCPIMQYYFNGAYYNRIAIKTFVSLIRTSYRPTLLIYCINNMYCNRSMAPVATCSWAGILSAAARSSAQPGSFHSRDNLCQFLAWCRRQMLIPDTLLFETDDLVLRKNERSVVLCLLEAARRAVRHYHFPSVPDLVRLEQEIDDEMARETKTTTTTVPQPPVQRRPVIKVDMMSLDEMVSRIEMRFR